MRFQIVAPDSVDWSGTLDQAAIAPDGERLAFTASRPDGPPMLWLQPLDAPRAQPLPGTEGAALPFWAPDSRSLAFFSQGQLKRVDAAGGPVQVIAGLPAQARGGAWSRDGTIVFGTDSGPLFSVPASGGVPKAVTTLNEARRDFSHRVPQFLPDGRLLYLVQGGQRAGVYVGALGADDAQLILASPSGARYAEPGYLLFLQLDTLMAQRFDLESLRTIGDPLPLAEPAGQSYAGVKVSTSDTGVLVFNAAHYPRSQLQWFGRDGKRLERLAEPGEYRQIALSPDGKRVAIHLAGPRGTPADIWVLDVATGIGSPVTRTPAAETGPVWLPDGRIVFSSNRHGPFQLHVQAVGGGSVEERLLDSAENVYPKDVYDGGRFLLFLNQNGRALSSLPLDGTRTPTPLLKSDAPKDQPHVSPDGRWVAYTSRETGSWEIYVASFPDFGGQRRLSTNGGVQPRWRADGGELYFIADDGTFMAIEITNGSTLETRPPRRLFTTSPYPSPGLDQYAVTADGRRFLVAEPIEEAAKPMTVIVNWAAGLGEPPR
jgi:Tol biopolymer transport system component